MKAWLRDLAFAFVVTLGVGVVAAVYLPAQPRFMAAIRTNARDNACEDFLTNAKRQGVIGSGIVTDLRNFQK